MKKDPQQAQEETSQEGKAQEPAVDSPVPSKPRRASKAPAQRVKRALTGKSPSEEPRTRRRATKPVVDAEKTGPERAAPPRIPALLAQYRQEVRPTLMQEFGYPNPLAVPYLEKVVLNIGLGEALQNPRALETAANDLATITGQRPVITRAHKSVAEFKVRKGMAIGTTVTLRAHRMYDFLQRLVNTTLARIRDFRGVSRSSFDGTGNYSLGLREQLVFPEIDYNQVDRIRGLQITFVTSARTDQEALRLLEMLGMPFARDGETK